MRLSPKLKEDLKKYLLDKIRIERQRVVVYSSVGLTGDEKKLLQTKLPNISFQDALYHIDETLLAGIVITVGSKVIDLSLKGALSNLRHIVYEGT